MEELPDKYLDPKQAIQKYPFLTKNMLKNLLSKDIASFRAKVVRRLGRRIILDEEAFLKYISESKDLPVFPSQNFMKKKIEGEED